MELKDIDKLAELARLDIPQEEKESVSQDLSAVLAYVSDIQKVAIADVHSDYALLNIAREDEHLITRESYTEVIVKEMPESKDGFLKVKKIL